MCPPGSYAEFRHVEAGIEGGKRSTRSCSDAWSGIGVRGWCLREAILNGRSGVFRRTDRAEDGGGLGAAAVGTPAFHKEGTGRKWAWLSVPSYVNYGDARGKRLQ